MVNWQPSRPCPACNRGDGGQAIRCENCLTLGCSNGNCRHGGANPFCKVCNKRTKKVRV